MVISLLLFYFNVQVKSLYLASVLFLFAFAVSWSLAQFCQKQQKSSWARQLFEIKESFFCFISSVMFVLINITNPPGLLSMHTCPYCHTSGGRRLSALEMMTTKCLSMAVCEKLDSLEALTFIQHHDQAVSYA